MQKKKMQNKRKVALILVLSMAMMVLLTACQNKEGKGAGKESTKQETANNAVDEVYAKIAEFQDGYTDWEKDMVYPSQIGNIVVGDGELSDPKMIDENSDSIWMGYSEMELGFLTPEEMPNCYNSGEDVGLYSPAVQYNGEYYLYVNDFLKIFSKNARTPEELEKLEKLQQYADVWCTYPNSEGEIKVLGGLEEYGRYRAKQGGNVE